MSVSRFLALALGSRVVAQTVAIVSRARLCSLKLAYTQSQRSGYLVPLFAQNVAAMITR